MTSAAVALSKWWSAHHILQKIAIYFQLIYAFLYFAFFSSIILVYYINMLPVHLRRGCCCSLTAKYQDWVFNVQPPKGQMRAHTTSYGRHCGT